MEIRSTERVHMFTNELFASLSLFSIQGLTLSEDRKWTAGIEAIQYNDDETVDLSKVFPLIQVKAKYYLTQTLGIPLYFITWKLNVFTIYEVNATTAGDFEYIQRETLDELKFVKWWSTLKGLPQPKPLLEQASKRTERSIFDKTLEKYGLAWGGNIDGYMFKSKKFACIVENIYTQKHPLESDRGEPSYYFHSYGPNYNTWFPTVKLAMDLQIPLFLFTIEGKSDRPRIGFTVIDYLDTQCIHYKNNIKPNNNIIEGLDAIRKAILSQLDSAPPYIKY